MCGGAGGAMSTAPAWGSPRNRCCCAAPLRGSHTQAHQSAARRRHLAPPAAQPGRHRPGGGRRRGRVGGAALRQGAPLCARAGAAHARPAGTRARRRPAPLRAALPCSGCPSLQIANHLFLKTPRPTARRRFSTSTSRSASSAPQPQSPWARCAALSDRGRPALCARAAVRPPALTPHFSAAFGSAAPDLPTHIHTLNTTPGAAVGLPAARPRGVAVGAAARRGAQARRGRAPAVAAAQAAAVARVPPAGALGRGHSHARA